MQGMDQSNTHTNVKHWHPFGCPVYALNQALQTGNIHHKWKPRARPGIYLGRSPQHARSVALVLNIQTGLVSPQFHVKMDRSFQTVGKNYNEESPVIKWMEECGFQSKDQESTKQIEETQVNHQGEPINKSEIESSQGQAQHDATLPPPEGGKLIPTNEDAEEPMLRRSSRKTKEPEWFVAHETLMINEEELMAEAHVRDPDMMYYHEAMKEHDREEFLTAMDSEVNAQINGGSSS